jgi:hypothetical protein
MTTTDKLLPCREAFEKWAKNDRRKPPLLTMTSYAGTIMYSHADTQIAWDAWQAAWNATTPLPDAEALVEKQCKRCQGAGNVWTAGTLNFQCIFCNGTGTEQAAKVPVGAKEAIKHGLACAEIFVIKHCNERNAGAVLTAIKEGQAVIATLSDEAAGVDAVDIAKDAAMRRAINGLPEEGGTSQPAQPVDIEALHKDLVTLSWFALGYTPDRNTQTIEEVQETLEGVERIAKRYSGVEATSQPQKAGNDE